MQSRKDRSILSWAESIEAIIQALTFEAEDTSENDNKIIGYTCDGASVNTSHENGVIVLMQKEISPCIVLVKCLAHRLELAYKEALKQITLNNKVALLLTDLFSFYHKSS